MKPAFKLCVAAALGLAVLAGATDAAAASDQQSCFYASNINNFTTAGDRTVYIRVGVRDIYRLDLMTDCPELGFRQSVGFGRADGGSSICSAIDLTIQYQQAGARRICPVAGMRRLTPDEIAALPKGDRP